MELKLFFFEYLFFFLSFVFSGYVLTTESKLENALWRGLASNSSQ